MKSPSKLKVGIIGIGMVGGPVRKWLQEYKGYKRGRDLFCYDADPKKGYADDVNKADVVFISVPTPPNPDGSCNTSIVEKAVSTVKDGKIVVIKSTVSPGTVQNLQNKYPKKRFIFNPEFLTEFRAWEDFISPDRQIVATTSQSAADSLAVLNLLPNKNSNRSGQADYSKKSMNSTEAEMIKYASNVFGFVKVVYGNILADLSHALSLKDKTRVNYENIKEMIAADVRIGPSWLNVNHGDYCGAGGYCFPKDMNAFISFANSLAKDLEKNPALSKNGGAGKTNKDFIKILKKGISVLETVRDYNVELLKSQGLTVEDVSKHDKEIIVQKRKEIRKAH